MEPEHDGGAPRNGASRNGAPHDGVSRPIPAQVARAAAGGAGLGQATIQDSCFGVDRDQPVMALWN